MGHNPRFHDAGRADGAEFQHLHPAEVDCNLYFGEKRCLKNGNSAARMQRSSMWLLWI